MNPIKTFVPIIQGLKITFGHLFKKPVTLQYPDERPKVAARFRGLHALNVSHNKAKCVACHGQKGEKKFDATLTDEQLLDAILKGKKPEKPPNMPAFGEKGVTAEQAKALLDYMKQLRAAQ